MLLQIGMNTHIKYAILWAWRFYKAGGDFMSLPKNILIIDDDVPIQTMLDELLRKEGYDVSQAYSGTEALLLLDKQHPDLVLLDLMLPGLSGEEVLLRIKDIPVIIISAKAGIEDQVALLLGGAVDYVTKPFDTKVLLARIVVALRNAVSPSAVLSFSGITLNPSTHEVSVAEVPVRLIRTEFAILKMLLQNQHQVVTKSLLLDRISEDTPDCTESSLKIHVSNLRKKLREISGRDYIEAVWGIGFKLKTE